MFSRLHNPCLFCDICNLRLRPYLYELHIAVVRAFPSGEVCMYPCCLDIPEVHYPSWVELVVGVPDTLLWIHGFRDDRPRYRPFLHYSVEVFLVPVHIARVVRRLRKFRPSVSCKLRLFPCDSVRSHVEVDDPSGRGVLFEPVVCSPQEFFYSFCPCLTSWAGRGDCNINKRGSYVVGKRLYRGVSCTQANLCSVFRDRKVELTLYELIGCLALPPELGKLHASAGKF